MLLASKISSSLQFMGGHNARVNSLIFKDFLNELSIKIPLGTSDTKCRDDVIPEMFRENAESVTRLTQGSLEINEVRSSEAKCHV